MKKFYLALAAVALTAGSAAAQRPITPGEVARGNLGPGDPQSRNDAYYEEWLFAGRRGETVIVNMESSAFDSYLYLGTLRRGNFQEIARDDDGGNGLSARLEVRLPEDGEYVIRASSLHERTGPYTLTLSGGRPTSAGGWYEPQPADPVYGGDYDSRDGGPLEAGERVRGRLSSSDSKLDNGAPFHLYTYRARRGERLTLTLRSQDFDAYLVIGTSGGRHGIGSVLARDDDGAGGRDSRLDVTLPTDAEYVIRVNSLMPESGEYTLEVESSLGGGYDPRPRPGDYEDDEDYDDGRVSRRVVGRWALTNPGARVQPDDWNSASASAPMGILSIDEDGAYTWRKNGRTLRGQLVPYTPRRGAQPNTRYYTINDGREEFYISVVRDGRQRYMEVNNRATGMLVARGYRERGSF
jgi:hypothetical protein